MVPTRRRLLQTAGATTLAALAGCSSASPLGSEDSTPEYTLDVESVDASPVEHALYRPGDGALFGDPARTALDAVLPDGRHTTYGYRPLPDDAYVARDGAYYQIKHVVTGRERLERALVRVDTVPRDQVPEDAVLVDSLPDRARGRSRYSTATPRPTARRAPRTCFAATPTSCGGRPNGRVDSEPATWTAAS
ncbi:hypothetical protein ACFQJD_11755 [Haloplanus sp. GCM10025708]|uniref:hypothetical protein n=1 Tax=Haloplanus sp. GCM10025708 TaxID=3252679 RepID=UPI0036061C8F